MRRNAYLTVALVMLVIGLVGLVAFVASLLPSDPVYSVATVQAGLRTNPIAWIGRTVRVPTEENSVYATIRPSVSLSTFGFRLTS